ncbi:SHOCT domain-containing protein [Brevundimonas albigilva]|uniref:SHOCT domain-containing protein n=1 Tax=Brevundimonas albigilva TaxID=1312364 RepID=A0ABY4SP22_9CAUL|nr:SHOCT domain-containing protein [Brevundimonas albigilva]UQV19637.1 SHOCT domain-containing protein [Brevundimonas albigilva]URI15337.1 SHOCT domain-containing protein [Brevundimonas albigilva]
MEILIIVVFIGLIPAIVAKNKGHGPFVLWWLYGAAIFIVAIVHSIMLKPQGEAARRLTAPPPGFSHADEIAKLADLKEKGVLTEAEFQAKKAQLLS